MLLAQASPSDPISRAAFTGFFRTAPILKDMQFFSKTGSSALIKTAREGSVPASIFRSLNENKTSTGPTPNYDTIAKKIVSFQAKVDKILEQRNEDVATELEAQTILEAMEHGWIFQNQAFHADSAVDSEGFDGIANLVHASWSKSLDDANFGYADGLIVPLGNSDANRTKQEQFVEAVLWLISIVRGGASHLYMPEALKIRMVSIGKALGYYRSSIDEFGQTIDMIGDTVIRGAGRTKAGGEILNFDETVGGSDICASVYAVRWGEGTDLTVLTSKGLVGEYSGLISKHYINEVDMDAAIVRQNPTAIVKLKGFRLI